MSLESIINFILIDFKMKNKKNYIVYIHNVTINQYKVYWSYIYPYNIVLVSLKNSFPCTSVKGKRKSNFKYEFLYILSEILTTNMLNTWQLRLNL